MRRPVVRSSSAVVVRVVGALACIASSAVGGRAAADALPRARLRYEVAPPLTETCPDAKVFRTHVALRLGYDPFVVSDGAADPELEVRLDTSGARARAEIVLRDARGRALGTKRLDEPAAGCEELVANAAFAASLALDPAAATRPPAVAPVPEPASPSPPAPPPPPAPQERPPASGAASSVAPPREPSTVAPPWEAFVRAGLGASSGVGPAPMPVVAFGVDVRRAFLSFGVEGRADLGATDRRDGVDLRASLLAAGLSTCGHLRGLGRVEPSACAVAYVGALRGEATGITSPRRDTTVHAAIGPRVGIRVAITGALGFDARVDVPFVVTDTALTVDGRTLWTTPAVSVVGTAGVSVWFH